MTKSEAQRYGHGLYRIYWKDGGSSEAAVGSLHDGTRWFAPTNWSGKTPSVIACTSWAQIDHIELAG